MRLSSRARVGLAAAPASFASLIAWAAWAAAVPSGPPQPASLSARSTSWPEGGKSGKRLVITYSTEQNGYLTPCGCSSPMLGGIPRRATWIKSLEADDAVVRIDNGDLTEALGRQDELKAETIVEMLNAQDYGAINLGEKDFRLGVAYLQSLQARFKGTLLCGNVLKQDGAPLFGESTVMNRQVGGKPVKVAVAGVLSEQYEQPITALNPDLKVQPAEEALTRIAPALATAGDVRVLLFHGPKSEAVELAKKFPVFQLVVCAHEGDHPMEPVKVGDAMVVCPGQDGKYAERAMFAEGAARVGDVKAVPLGPEFADDARMMQIKQAYLDRVTAENLLAKVPKIPLTDGEKFAGSEACAGCHADAYKVWKASGHAHALETLAKVKQDLDPECVQCHVVGLDRGTGFESREKTPGFSHVGCESCHGPAGKHAADPTAAGTKMKKLDQMACVGCHNPQNSPRFDFATYWPKVKH
jgi:hypothetical protein